MKKIICFIFVLLFSLTVNATVYNDSVGEQLADTMLDIVSVEVLNDATNITFLITLSGDPIATDWGKYLVAIDSVPGGDTTGNGWGRPISMPSGMDYFIGSWVDYGSGAETYSWDGASWNRDNATWEPPSDIEVPVTTTFSVTLTTTLSSLGLSIGDSFVFDVFTAGGGGTDSANDALSDPSQSITDWPGPYASASTLSYTVVFTKAYAPVPSNGQIVGASLDVLSWTNPDPNNPADTITSDVYLLDAGTSILTEDPNMGPDVTDPGVTLIADDTTAEMVAISGLVDDHYYYWAVHCTDPHADPNGNPVTTQGNIWYFNTGDAPPVVGQPVDQYMYIYQEDGDGNPNVRTFTISIDYTDDGRSPITADVNNLNWGWDPLGPDGVLGTGDEERGIELVGVVETPSLPATTTSGNVTATFHTKYDAADPNYTTDLTGYWDIRLEVTDAGGTRTVLGDTGHHEIWKTCKGATYADPDDLWDGYYDTNGDCIVSLPDFADFAAKWLNCNDIKRIDCP